MWPFNRKRNEKNLNTPSPPRFGASTAIIGLSEYSGWGSRYADYAEYGYKRNPTIRACINLKGRALGGLPLRVFRQEPDLTEISLPSHPVWNILRRPNRRQSWARFIHTMMIHLDLDGNAFVLRLGLRSHPQELILLRPDRVTLELNDTRTDIIGYKYGVYGNTIMYDPDEVLHITTASSLDDWRGEAPLHAVAVAGDLENNGLEWNCSLQRNLGVPSIVLEGEEGTEPPDPEMVKRLEAKFQERYGGFKNVGKIAIYSGGFKAKQLGYSPRDMDWLSGMIGAQIRIAIVLGVPPELIGIQGQKTYSNYREARQSFYEETILPEADNILSEITSFLQGMVDETGEAAPFMIGIDRDLVPAIHESRLDVWTAAREAFLSGGMTLDEYCNELNQDGPGGLTGSLRIIPAGYMPVEDIFLGNDQRSDEPNPSLTETGSDNGPDAAV